MGNVCCPQQAVITPKANALNNIRSRDEPILLPLLSGDLREADLIHFQSENPAKSRLFSRHFLLKLSKKRGDFTVKKRIFPAIFRCRIS
jgi:hypothetical protein